MNIINTTRKPHLAALAALMLITNAMNAQFQNATTADIPLFSPVQACTTGGEHAMLISSLMPT